MQTPPYERQTGESPAAWQAPSPRLAPPQSGQRVERRGCPQSRRFPRPLQPTRAGPTSCPLPK
jgi:hypothetical protein